nr:MAG TPA: hypothetical protein [Caudoviricetes sp.]
MFLLLKYTKYLIKCIYLYISFYIILNTNNNHLFQLL